MIMYVTCKSFRGNACVFVYVCRSVYVWVWVYLVYRDREGANDK